MKSADVRTGAPVMYEGQVWYVWSPADRPGYYWLMRDGKVHPEPVRAVYLDSTQKVTTARSSS